MSGSPVCWCPTSWHVLAVSHAGQQPVVNPPTLMILHLLSWKLPSSPRLFYSSSSLCLDLKTILRMTPAVQSPSLPRRASSLFPTDHAPGMNKIPTEVHCKRSFSVFGNRSQITIQRLTYCYKSSANSSDWLLEHFKLTHISWCCAP